MMKKLICIMCAVIVLSVSVFALADTAPLSITTTFDKDTYEVGTEITATYQISGGSGEYTSGRYTCYAWDDSALVNIQSGQLDVEKKTGQSNLYQRQEIKHILVSQCMIRMDASFHAQVNMWN